MTTRKLTPAEALECLRDWRSGDIDFGNFGCKWGPFIDDWDKLEVVYTRCFAVLEEALAQKPPAGKVKPVYAPCGRRFTLESAVWHGGDEDGAGMPSEVVVYGSGDMGAGEVATYRKVQIGETPKPAAPVPSDEEIVDAIESARLIYGQTMGTRALRLLARRIGVQGVPQ